MKWDNLAWPVWHSQLPTTTSPPPINLCQFTAARLPQANSLQGQLAVGSQRESWTCRWAEHRVMLVASSFPFSHSLVPMLLPSSRSKREEWVGWAACENETTWLPLPPHYPPILPTTATNILGLFSPKLSSRVSGRGCKNGPLSCHHHSVLCLPTHVLSWVSLWLPAANFPCGKLALWSYSVANWG